MKREKEYLSTIEAAKKLGISRVAVFKRIKKGQIPAKKIGRNYIISQSFFNKKEEKDEISLSKETKNKLKKIGVSLVYFFGSRATNHHFPLSDIDIGLVFKNKKSLFNKSNDLFLEAYNILSSDIEKEEGVELDISLLQKANPALAMKAIKEGKILFQLSSLDRADFEEETFRKYNDYIFLQNEFREANISAFS